MQNNKKYFIDFQKLFKLKVEDIQYKRVLIILWIVTGTLLVVEKTSITDPGGGLKFSGSFLLMTTILTIMALIKLVKLKTRCKIKGDEH